MKNNIPATMQAVLLEAQGNNPAFGQIPVPRPGPGQVLVRVAASPVNPSDLGFMQGSYGFQKPFPVVPDFEGSGTVVSALYQANPTAGKMLLVATPTKIPAD